MEVTYIIMFVCFCLAILASLRKPEEDIETKEIEDDYDYTPMYLQEDESDGDYWCPICGYHATKEGYFTAHLMNEHNNN